MTFSIVARCARTGQFGAAVASSSPAVAARCIRVRAGVGAAASQNITDPQLGTRALDLIERGATPAQACDILKDSSEFIAYRQVMAIDLVNTPVIFTGAQALGSCAQACGRDAACAGNMLARSDVPRAMLEAFESSRGLLGERLMRALTAGQAAGGEAGPVHSAGLLVADTLAWPSVDLRLDWVENDPVGELAKVWALFMPQIDSYIMRARDPRKAPSFGVPGDP